jgi:RNA polymerase sigma factor (sigma-70 family)
VEKFSHAPDPDLLAAYVDRGEEPAFAELVLRYQNMVLGACSRRLGDPVLAQDAAQMTFLLMVQKARSLRSHTNLAGWLYQTANFQASNLMRKEALRSRNSIGFDPDTEALTVTTEAPVDDPALKAHLDEALMTLREQDREAVVLRFFSGQSLRGVGDAQGTTEDAARKRITRALERMADFLRGRGIASGTVAAITAALSLPAQAAPAGFVSTVTASAHSAQLASAAAAHAAWWTKLKIAGLLMVAVAVPVVWQWNTNRTLQRENERLRSRQAVIEESIAPAISPEFPREAPLRAGTLNSLQISEPNRLFQLLDALFAAESQQRQAAKIDSWKATLRLNPAQVTATETALGESSAAQRNALHQLSSGDVNFAHVMAFFLAEETAHRRIEAVLDAEQRPAFQPLLERERQQVANDLALWRLADLQPVLRLAEAQKPAVLSVLTEGVNHTLRALIPLKISDLPTLLSRLDAIGATEHAALAAVLTPEQHAAFQNQTIRRRQALDLLLQPDSTGR